jgi:hypothetical protein
VLVLWSGAALAAEPRAVVLRAARMYDGKAEAVSSPGVVVVEGGVDEEARLAAVGGAASRSALASRGVPRA